MRRTRRQLSRERLRRAGTGQHCLRLPAGRQGRTLSPHAARVERQVGRGGDDGARRLGRLSKHVGTTRHEPLVRVPGRSGTCTASPVNGGDGMRTTSCLFLPNKAPHGTMNLQPCIRANVMPKHVACRETAVQCRRVRHWHSQPCLPCHHKAIRLQQVAGRPVAVADAQLAGDWRGSRTTNFQVSR